MSGSAIHRLDLVDLEARVKAMYGQVALEPHHEFHFEIGRALAERLGYPAEDLDAIPAPAVESFAGVGYYLDLAAIRPGETVVDLGSGSGTDSFLAAIATGPTGRVIGVDMTTAQLAKSRHLANTASVTNVDFRDGRIERPPVEDASVDCIISNGVINLAPDKQGVFEAAATALRAGGRMAFADIVTAVRLPDGVTCDASLWAACIGGAAQRDDYLDTVRAAGFDIDTIRENDKYRFLSDRAVGATTTYGVTSISIRATRR
jgi:SAM-dependent methyltransferase